MITMCNDYRSSMADSDTVIACARSGEGRSRELRCCRFSNAHVTCMIVLCNVVHND